MSEWDPWKRFERERERRMWDPYYRLEYERERMTWDPFYRLERELTDPFYRFIGLKNSVKESYGILYIGLKESRSV